MKLGFICPTVPGHLFPMTALARRLQARNHDVVFLYSSGAHGLPFVPGPDRLNEERTTASRMQGADVLKYSLGVILQQSEFILQSLPKVVEQTGVEALLIDRINFYVELGPMHLRMPYIHVCNALHLDFSGHTPLCSYGWPHESSARALARNREGVAHLVSILAGINAEVRAYAENAGLKIDWEDPDATVSPWAHLSQTPRAFDFEGAPWPPSFHHTGPFHDGAGRPKVAFPWERLTGQPLVFASMGTLLNGRPEVFRTIVAALRARPDLQLVLSIGDQLTPDALGPFPPNAVVVSTAPQLELLKRAAVCITHAGLNTVLEALAQGVPQVAIPVSYDQPGVAARIVHHRTGLATTLDKLTAAHLGELLDEVLTNPLYRENARNMQRAISAADGLSRAADLVERSLGIASR